MNWMYILCLCAKKCAIFVFFANCMLINGLLHVCFESCTHHFVCAYNNLWEKRVKDLLLHNYHQYATSYKHTSTHRSVQRIYCVDELSNGALHRNAQKHFTNEDLCNIFNLFLNQIAVISNELIAIQCTWIFVLIFAKHANTLTPDNSRSKINVFVFRRSSVRKLGQIWTLQSNKTII